MLRRKLLNVPFGLDQPYWVDDADFDIEYHVREIALPRPGSDAQLDEQVSRLHARPLDRSRPLWELYLITGLAKNRAAVYTKIHHAAIDGASGAELLTVLFDLTPDGRELPPAEPFRPAAAPALPVLAVKAAARLAWLPVQTRYPGPVSVPQATQERRRGHTERAGPRGGAAVDWYDRNGPLPGWAGAERQVSRGWCGGLGR